MKRIGIFPGSFDPITKGHENIVKRALPLFDEIYIAIGINDQKKSFFSLKQRISWIEQSFDDERIKACSYEGLTIDFCKKKGIDFMIRGIRNVADFQYENEIFAFNEKKNSSIETVFFIALPEFHNISSTLVRNTYRMNGNYRQYMPDSIFKK